jgi:hypothetical protein
MLNKLSDTTQPTIIENTAVIMPQFKVDTDLNLKKSDNFENAEETKKIEKNIV